MRRSRDALTTDELQILLDVGGIKHACWLLLGSDAGLRNAEIRAISPDHVLPSGVIYVRGKGGVERNVPATDRLLAALRAEDLAYLQEGRGQEVPYVRVCGRALLKRFRKLARAAGVYLPGRCIHTLRHTYATRLVGAGVPLHVVQRLLGHANIRTTSIYLHAGTADLVRAARALQAFDRAGGSESSVNGNFFSGQQYLFGASAERPGKGGRQRP